MQIQLDQIGVDWLLGQVTGWVDTVQYMTPVEYCEAYRYLPEAVTKNPGPYRVSVAPYTEEIINCFDLRSDVHEVNVLKGIQIGYSLVVECIIMYMAAHIGTVQMCYVTVDIDTTQHRIKTGIIPMFRESGLDVVQSHDVGNARKSGATKNLVEFKGGGYLMALGANSPQAMRDKTFRFMAKDEIEGWPSIVKRGNDAGDPDKLTDNRLKGFLGIHKIIRGSSPVYREGSRIDKLYEMGDQRKYMVRCLDCGFPQEIRWSGKNKETNKAFGFEWELDSDGVLVPEETRYHCANCRHPHYEHDKVKLFAKDHGAKWKPTSTPKKPGVRSYHIPAFLSPLGARPWSDCVSQYLEGVDPKTGNIMDVKAYQSYYNDVLGRSFAQYGSKIHFTMVSAHRRQWYSLGQVPNKSAERWAGGPILMVTCTVDVHLHFLSVAVIGWTRKRCNFLIERLEYRDESETGCTVLESPVWAQLAELIGEKEYTADDGKKYVINITLIDMQYAPDTVKGFCSEYGNSGVFPIQGRDRPAKSQKTAEFGPFTTKLGVVGFGITVDTYKDRMSSVLRRHWTPEAGQQKSFHFNAPVDTDDEVLMELTRETRGTKVDKATNQVTNFWRRTGARNEMWDTLGYAHAAIEIYAWSVCVDSLDQDIVDWDWFWDWLEGKGKLFTE